MESEVDAPQPRCKIASAEEKLQLPLLAQSHGENGGGGGGGGGGVVRGSSTPYSTLTQTDKKTK